MKNFHSRYERVNLWYEQAEFELITNAVIKTDIVGFEFEDHKVKLDIWGNLTAKRRFYFGANGPTFDTISSREGSCFHDAFYYISLHGGFDDALDNDSVRKSADLLLRKLCLENGMWAWRAEVWYLSVRLLGESKWS